jgi:excisionase family DNA binding protein
MIETVEDHQEGGRSAHDCCGRHAGVKGSPWHDETVPSRFLTLADVAETLNVSASQVYALVRSGELRAIKVGGRGQWRVESAALEEWISQTYARTEEFVRTHPLSEAHETVELD